MTRGTATADVIYLLIAHVRLQGKPHTRGSTSCDRREKLCFPVLGKRIPLHSKSV